MGNLNQKVLSLIFAVLAIAVLFFNGQHKLFVCLLFLTLSGTFLLDWEKPNQRNVAFAVMVACFIALLLVFS